jgi:hypothetical protein
MGLRCLMGHDFDQPQVEREREVEGEEVLVTVSEVKTCRRCGERRVVSESKEITTLAEYHLGPDGVADSGASADDAGSASGAAGPADDAGPASGAAGPADDAGAAGGAAGPADDAGAASGAAGPADDAGSAGEAGAESTPAASGPASGVDGEATHAESGDAVDETVAALRDDPSASADDAEVLATGAAGDDGEGDPEPELDLEAAGVVDPTEAVADGTADAVGDASDPVTDDGVILDEGDDDGGRGHGEWPDAPTRTAGAVGNAPADGAGAADAAGGDDGADGADWPDPAGEDEGFDAVPANAGANGSADAGADADADVAVEGLTPRRRADDGYVGHERAAVPDDSFVTADEPGDASDAPASRTEFYCPNCGHAGAAGETSMRPGDVCPSCRRGYVDERAT